MKTYNIQLLQQRLREKFNAEFSFRTSIIDETDVTTFDMTSTIAMRDPYVRRLSAIVSMFNRVTRTSYVLGRTLSLSPEAVHAIGFKEKITKDLTILSRRVSIVRNFFNRLSRSATNSAKDVATLVELIIQTMKTDDKANGSSHADETIYNILSKIPDAVKSDIVERSSTDPDAFFLVTNDRDVREFVSSVLSAVYRELDSITWFEQNMVAIDDMNPALWRTIVDVINKLRKRVQELTIVGASSVDAATFRADFFRTVNTLQNGSTIMAYLSMYHTSVLHPDIETTHDAVILGASGLVDSIKSSTLFEKPLDVAEGLSSFRVQRLSSAPKIFNDDVIPTITAGTMGANQRFPFAELFLDDAAGVGSSTVVWNKDLTRLVTLNCLTDDSQISAIYSILSNFIGSLPAGSNPAIAAVSKVIEQITKAIAFTVNAYMSNYCINLNSDRLMSILIPTVTIANDHSMAADVLRALELTQSHFDLIRDPLRSLYSYPDAADSRNIINQMYATDSSVRHSSTFHYKLRRLVQSSIPGNSLGTDLAIAIECEQEAIFLSWSRIMQIASISIQRLISLADSIPTPDNLNGVESRRIRRGATGIGNHGADAMALYVSTARVSDFSQTSPLGLAISNLFPGFGYQNIGVLAGRTSILREYVDIVNKVRIADDKDVNDVSIEDDVLSSSSIPSGLLAPLVRYVTSTSTNALGLRYAGVYPAFIPADMYDEYAFNTSDRLSNLIEKTFGTMDVSITDIYLSPFFSGLCNVDYDALNKQFGIVTPPTELRSILKLKPFDEAYLTKRILATALTSANIVSLKFPTAPIVRYNFISDALSSLLILFEDKSAVLSPKSQNITMNSELVSSSSLLATAIRPVSIHFIEGRARTIYDINNNEVLLEKKKDTEAR